MYKKSFMLGLMVLSSSLSASYVDYKKIINDLYTDMSGYRIPEEEKTSVRDAGGDPTYGEILYESVEFLLDVLKLTEDDVFYDFGSGIGKMVVQVYLTSPVRKSVGIELSKTRCSCAAKIVKQVSGLYDICMKAENDIRKKLDKKGLKSVSKKTIKVIEANILKTDVSDATAIFICATCFSDDLMKQLANKILALPDGVRIVTLKQFPARDGLKLKETFTLPMTWSKTTPVYLYEIDRSKEEAVVTADELLKMDDEDDALEDLLPVPASKVVNNK